MNDGERHHDQPTPELEKEAERLLEHATERGLITSEQADATLAEVRERLVAAGLYAPSNRQPAHETSIRVVIPDDVLDDDTLAELARELGLDDDLLAHPSSQEAGRKHDPFDVWPVEDWERYELIEFVGRGGMGDVYKARDPRLGRFVALKFLRRDDPEQLRRFMREAQVQAKVDHENLCPIYEVGEVEGHSYIAMQYIAGGSIKEIADLLSPRDKVEIMVDVADALHAAHQAGLIHRDIKPANILVEREADGRWHPYVVDFGIAREIDTPHDLTVSGMVLGTPAFSSPEQVRGESSNLDRRTDVYGLGATLYWFLTGKSPYEGAYPDIIAGVTDREPVPPHRIDRTIAVDLETIVLKCLEKEQDRRYPSARALSEDLRRYLAGEPITARPATVFYKLGKQVRKHPGLVAAALIVVAAFIALGTLSLQANLRTRRQAAVAQQLGEQAREIESFARVSAMMPLHDRTPERAVIRSRMQAIETEIERLGTIGAGPGHYALGRGFLTLQDYPAARGHLEEAVAAGYNSPSVATSLGLSLGRLYQRELILARRIDNETVRAARIRDIEAGLRDPALDLLESSEGSTLDAPRYVEALIAFYGGDLERALSLSRQAFEAQPWLYEAKVLEGDVRLETGLETRLTGDPEGALDALDRAGAAYRQAAEIARSDPSIHEGECAVWTQVMEIRSRRGENVDQPFANAVAACDRALLIDSDRSDAHERLSHLYWRWADLVNDRGGDPAPFLEQAIAAADRATDIDPESVSAYSTRGGALTVAALNALARGQDPRPDLRAAIASFQNAIALDPASVLAHDDLGYAWERLAQYEMTIGLDPRPSLDRAIDAFGKAIEIEPAYANAYNNSGIAEWRLAVYDLQTGSDPMPSLAAAVTAYEAAIDRNPNYAYAYANRGLAERWLAMVRLDSGSDPTTDIAAARSDLERALALNPRIFWAYPELTAVELLAARFAIASGLSPRRHLAAAEVAARRALEVNPSNAVAYQSAAEVHRWRAENRLQRGLSVREDVVAGQRLLEQAEELNPGFARTFVTRAALKVIQAEAEPQAASRSALAADAAAALRHAFELNPLLERESEQLRDRIEGVPHSPV